jgi:hypothetical protein
MFIRDELQPNKLTKEEIVDFIQCIKKINPDLVFVIKIICHKTLIDINLPNVIIITDQKEFGNWTRPNIDWSDIFSMK